ncbi:peptidase S8/S53 domain-containing protein [Cunninghamella echinulata]|nr:peptidase S8/S53 domain-containing protein [Cunninghamella echinulata]
MSLLSPLKDILHIRQTYHDSNVFSDLPFTILQSLSLQKRSLASHPYIKHIYPIYEVDQPVLTQEISTNGTGYYETRPYDTPVTQIKKTHDLQYDGKNIFVCLLDSGVDYTHPALGGGFGPQFKIKYGANLVDPKEDDEAVGHHRDKNDPFDPCPDNGHGTHVSGIIAGVDHKMKFYGVAPGVQLGMWRVFGCKRGTSEDTIIQGLNLAQKAGCDIVNLSLGFQNAWSEDIMAVVAERMSQQGVIVVAVSGNQADDGVFLQNTPGTAKSVVSVASINNAKMPSKVLSFNIFPNQNFIYQPSTTTENFPNGPLQVLYDSQDQDKVSLGCEQNDYDQVQKGSILLIRRGQCTFDIKSQLARQKGAIAVLLYDDQEIKDRDDLFIIQTTSKEKAKTPFPMASIHYKVAKPLIDYKSKNNNNMIQVNVEKDLVSKDISNALQVSSFTSAGPTYELELKPNIAGIGGQVFSTIPLHQSKNDNSGGFPKGWGLKSGTSMASPHISGVLALVLQSFRERTNQKVTSQFVIEHLQNHAKIIMSNTTFNMPDHPILQGAGLAQPFDTIMDPIHVSPSQISFNDTASFTQYKTHTLQISNFDQNKPIRLQIKHLPSLTVYPYGQPNYNNYNNFNNFNKYSSSPVAKRDAEPWVTDQGPNQSATEAVNKMAIDDTTNPFTPLEPFQKSNELAVHIAFDEVAFELQPQEIKNITLQVILPDNVPYYYQMYGGYIQLVDMEEKNQNNDNQKEKIHASIPYFGVLGAVNQLPLFDDGFPYLAQSDDPIQLYTSNQPFSFKLSSFMNSSGKQQQNQKSLSGLRKDSNNNNIMLEGLPNIVYRLLTASPEIQVDIIRLNDYSSSSSSDQYNNNNNNKRDVNEEKENKQQKVEEQEKEEWVGYLPGSPYLYLERNRLQNDLYYRELLWDGQIQTDLGIGQPTSYVPVGYTYALRVRALRLLGDYENPDHWEIWQSGPIIVS